MKKFILFLLLLSFIGAHAQTINSLTIYPSNPTTNDNILILARCTFTSGSCDPHTQGFSVAGNSISTWALHCLGMLTVICTDTDTFAIGMLPAGVYTVNYQLNTGSGPVPCSPGIVPGPNANATFTVSSLTNIPEDELNNNSVEVYPNPVKDRLSVISNRLSGKEEIEIYDVFGKKVFSKQPEAKSQKQTVVDISELAPGIYFLKVMDENTQWIIKVMKM